MESNSVRRLGITLLTSKFELSEFVWTKQVNICRCDSGGGDLFASPAILHLASSHCKCDSNYFNLHSNLSTHLISVRRMREPKTA